MPIATARVSAFSFESDLGWFAFASDQLDARPVLVSLVFGDASERLALRRLNEACAVEDLEDRTPSGVRQWIDQLKRYAGGEAVSLSDIPVVDDHLSPFGREVVAACRAIPYGTTLSYGELAKRAGRPRAARAVGTVMAKNVAPLVVPCHRVLGAGGKLGGYSAFQGLEMKQRLLDREQIKGI